MRLSPASAAVVLTAVLALAGCGGSDDSDVARTTAQSTPTATDGVVVTSTEAAPAGTVVVPPAATVTTTPDSGGAESDGGGDSGGTTPPTETVTVQKPPTVDGDRPAVTRRSDGTARATAADEGQAQIWCDAARQGSYDDLLGDATTFVIAVQGSDSVTRCALPR